MIIKISKNTLVAIIISFLVIVGIIITLIFNNGQEVSSNEQSGELKQNRNSSSENLGGTNAGTKKQTTMGAVDIEVTPKQLGKNEPQNVFNVTFNTHSVELDFDFTKIISLKDDLGNTYEALQWTGDKGGHHLSGDIIFPAIDEKARKIDLNISEIEGKTGIFTWDLTEI